MARILLSLVLLIVAVTELQARTKPVRRPPPIIAAPIIFFGGNLCAFAAGATAPDWTPARQKMALGDCPPRATPRSL